MTHGKDNGGSKQADCCQFWSVKRPLRVRRLAPSNRMMQGTEKETEKAKHEKKPRARLCRVSTDGNKKQSDHSARRTNATKLTVAIIGSNQFASISSVDIVFKASIFVQFDKANSAKKPLNLDETILKGEAKLLLAL